MIDNGTSLMARHAFERGSALVREGNCELALPELQNAESFFRRIDVSGHPFTSPLSNGVSGLANTLFLTGLCHQKLGSYNEAARHYETSFINAKFENSRRFKAFSASINENLLACYENLFQADLWERSRSILDGDPEVDTAYRFPFSLDQDAAVLARLFELAPERHEEFSSFYARAKEKDSALRKLEKRSDEASMNKLSFLIWSGLLIIWAIYGMFVIDALVHRK